MNQSPWMDAYSAATYVRKNYETVRRACVLYQRSKGKQGLRSSQSGPKGRYSIHVDDADRWVRRLPPLAEAS